LGEWAQAARRLQKTIVSIEAVQLTTAFGLIAALILLHRFEGANIGRALLLVYWALNLPLLGQEIGALARRYPYYRNLTLRALEPLGAPEEAAGQGGAEAVPFLTPPSIEFKNVSVEAAGHQILENIC